MPDPNTVPIVTVADLGRHVGQMVRLQG